MQKQNDEWTKDYRYPDGKTPAEEARDSAQMLGGVLLAQLLIVAAILWWACA